MDKIREKIKGVLDAVNTWLKLHPSVIAGLAIAAFCIYLQWIIIGLCISPVSFISLEAIPQVLATSAEVVAGLYGLTLTGYIFFLDRLQQKAEDNDLLDDIIELLKKRYHNMVLVLSANCFFVIVLVFGIIIYDTSSQLIPKSMYLFIVFETLFLIFTAVAFIIYFVITVVDPDKVSRVSLKYKQKLSNSSIELGSLQEFLRDYEDIEQLLKDKTEDLAISQIGINPLKALKHLKGQEMLEVRKLISEPLVMKLIKLSQYYSYMIFSGEMTVSKEMCDMAKEVKNELSNM